MAAFILAPTYTAPQFSPFGFCAPASRLANRYRGMCSQPRRPQYSPFNHFFGQVDDLLSEIDQQAQRQAHLEAHRKAHCQRQQRKRALRAQFAVSQNEPGWQVDGHLQGFERGNLSIEVTNENTLKVAGNTEWKSEKAPESDDTVLVEQVSENPQDVKDEAASEAETATLAPNSDTESEKSYQATVEDDFEDLGVETSSLISASSESSIISEPKESKGKEKAAEEITASENKVTSQPQEEQSQEEERPQGSFERTFRFPGRIDAANVRASFKDGTLSITVPRAPVQPTQRIDIL